MEHELYHYGILGMKWGIRRYQNKDGSLTEAGKKHYGAGTDAGSRGRKARARDAAEIGAKIYKLESKKQTSRNVEKVEFLRKMQQGLVKDLDDSEIEYGLSHIWEKIEKKDTKWAYKNYEKIEKSVFNRSKREIDKYRKQLSYNPYSDKGRRKMNDYNQMMADIMTKNAANIKAPSGRSVKFVARRGQLGVMMALADERYDMRQLKNGVWSSGRIAYKKKTVNMSR